VGSSEKLQTPVTITISEGPAPVAIPNVTNQTESDANVTLSLAGFHVTEKHDNSATVPLGKVIAQDPSPTPNGQPGQTITIDISKGPVLYPVPNVVTTSVIHPVYVSDATKILESAGFTVHVSSQGFFHIVTGQSPNAGSMEPAGTLITITAH
jgi:serine/threonine-protein kinase